MRREPMKKAGTFARHCAVYLLAPIFFFCGMAVAAEEPQGAKSAPIEVRLSEYAIEMPYALPAGPTTFLVRNEGKKSHSFKIEGPGIDEILSKPVRPHETENLQVTLQPGEYKVYCPI